MYAQVDTFVLLEVRCSFFSYRTELARVPEGQACATGQTAYKHLPFDQFSMCRSCC